jgi:hypothetical protein
MKRLWVVGVLVPWLSLAQSLSAAETLYADGELPAALKAADAALKTTTESKEVSKLHVVRGLVLLAQSKKDKAKAAFGQALQADAEAQLDAQRVPPAAVQLFEQVHHAAGHLAVEVAGGLVGEQQARLAGQRPGDGHPLLLATRQLGRVMARPRRQADPGQRFGSTAPAFGRRQAAIAQRHLDVVDDVEVGDQVEGLEDEADLLVAQARALVVAQAAHVHAVKPILATGEGFEQAGDREEGGLARAGWAGDGDKLARLDLQIELAQRIGLDHLGAVDLGKGLHLQHGGGQRHGGSWETGRGLKSEARRAGGGRRATRTVLARMRVLRWLIGVRAPPQGLSVTRSAF